MATAQTIVNVSLMIVGIALIVISQFVLVAFMEPVKDNIQDNAEHLDTFDGVTAMDDMFEAAVKWVPFIAGIGLVVIGAVNEFRRERVTGQRRA